MECLTPTWVDQNTPPAFVRSAASSAPCPWRCAAGRRRTGPRGGACAPTAARRRARSARRASTPSPTTKATIRWPRSASGTPTTAASPTAGCVEQRGLDLAGADLEAAGLDDVDRRPGRRCGGSRPASIAAASPVTNQPSSVNDVGRRLGPVEVAVEHRRRRGPAARRSSRRRAAITCRRRRRSRLSTPAIGTPTQPGRRSPSRAGRHGDQRLGHAVALDRRAARSALASARTPATGSGALPETSSRAPRECAARRRARRTTRDHTVGTPKYIVPPAAA